MISPKITDRILALSYSLFPSEFDFKAFHITFALKKNRILVIAQNSKASHPRNFRLPYKHTDCGTHSEMKAVIRLGRADCSDITFVNVRIDKNKKLKLSKPCAGCAALFKQTGFKNIFFSTEEGNFEKFS